MNKKKTKVQGFSSKSNPSFNIIFDSVCETTSYIEKLCFLNRRNTILYYKFTTYSSA